ncbi:MAG: hypothetical protein L0L58_10355 [Tetragenococcus koreensis]|nr:hypothetical protein [Tetragenococcus koreensis]MDN6735909.1 hypothetical protein [Tetragenococcus koreensis]
MENIETQTSCVLHYCLKVNEGKTIKETRKFILDYLKNSEFTDEFMSIVKRKFDNFVEKINVPEII